MMKKKYIQFPDVATEKDIRAESKRKENWTIEFQLVEFSIAVLCIKLNYLNSHLVAFSGVKKKKKTYPNTYINICSKFLR